MEVTTEVQEKTDLEQDLRDDAVHYTFVHLKCHSPGIGQTLCGILKRGKPMASRDVTCKKCLGLDNLGVVMRHCGLCGGTLK